MKASAADGRERPTPILIWWDYLQESEIGPGVPGKSSSRPTACYAAYYDQAIANAPHPAAARLWEEYLYTTTGQNLWLQGFARPIELPTLTDRTVNEAAYKALPPAPTRP